MSRSEVEDASRYLLVALLSCAPQVRDAVAEGNVGAPFVQATLDLVDRVHDISGRSRALEIMQGAAEYLAATEAGVGEPLTFTVLASASDLPRVEAIMVRLNTSGSGARVVTIRCPFADEHIYRTRGHELHMHGWPVDLQVGADGSLGTRVPHCDGAVRRGKPLPRIEIIVPPHLLKREERDRP